jgi:hypothetical protein
MKSILVPAALVSAALLSGCGATQQVATPAPAPKPPAAAPSVAAAAPAASPAELFVVLPDTGRVHAFGDTKNYFDFLSHGEVQLTRTRIGAGPGGKTLVYGITGDDVKNNRPSRGEQLLEGSLPAGAPFYGEAFKNGRFYLFGDLKDMKDFTAFGEVPYSYTEIGAGPKGETLVFVMNKDSYKNGKPMERKQRFQALRVAQK